MIQPMFATDEGQQFVGDLIAALEALPAKRLISGRYRRGDDYCALGAYDNYRPGLKPVQPGCNPIAVVVAGMNDSGRHERPAARYARMLAWARSRFKEAERHG